MERDRWEALRRSGRWSDEPGGTDWEGWAAFAGVALFWLVLGLLAPGLLGFLAALGRWGGG